MNIYYIVNVLTRDKRGDRINRKKGQKKAKAQAEKKTILHRDNTCPRFHFKDNQKKNGIPLIETPSRTAVTCLGRTPLRSGPKRDPLKTLGEMHRIIRILNLVL